MGLYISVAALVLAIVNIILIVRLRKRQHD